MRLPKGRTAKLAVLLAVVATIAQAQVSVSSGGTATGLNGTSPVLVVVNAVTQAAFITARFGLLRDSALTWSNSTSDPTSTILLSLRSDTGGGMFRILGSTAPTQSGTTCGTGPTLTGNNTNGSVTLGTAPGLPCTIVFNGSWTAAPHCYLNPLVLTTGTTTVRATGTTTAQFVITSSAALVAADKIEWFCVSE